MSASGGTARGGWTGSWLPVVAISIGCGVVAIVTPGTWPMPIVPLALLVVVAGCLAGRARIGWPDRIDRRVMLVVELALNVAAITLLLAGFSIFAPDGSIGRMLRGVVAGAGAVVCARRLERWGTPRAPIHPIDASGIAALEEDRLRKRRSGLGLPPIEETGTIGLAFSGGGVRSASLCVGVLRELAARGLLDRFDYLSTVSGGGWAAAGWLTELGAQASPSSILSSVGRLHDRLLRDGVDYLGLRGKRGVLALLGRAPILNRAIGLSVSLSLMIMLGASATLVFFLLGDPRFDQAPFIHDCVYWLRAGGGLDWLFAGRRIDIVRKLFGATVDLFAAPLVLTTVMLVPALLVWLPVLFARVNGTARLGSSVELEPRLRNVALRLFHYWLVAGVVALLLQGRAFMGLLVCSSVVAYGAIAILSRMGLPLPTGPGGRSWILGFAAAIALFVQYLSYEISWLGHDLEWITDQWYFHGVVRAPLALVGKHPVLAYVKDDPSLKIVGGFADAGVWPLAILVSAAVLMVLVTAASLLKRNRLALLPWWEDRIARAFFAPERVDLPLSDHDASPIAPLHLILATANSPRWDQDHWLIGVGPFELSALAAGGARVGYTELAHANPEIRNMLLKRAIGISASAVTAQAGETMPSAARGLIALLNLQLGWWLRSPSWRDQPQLAAGSALALLGREMFGTNTYGDELLFLSDGAHYDNLGIVALVERGVSTIVGVDAGADPRFGMSDARRALGICFDKGWRLESAHAGGVFPNSIPAPWQDRLTSDPAFEIRLVRGNQRCRVVLLKATLSRSWSHHVTAALRKRAEETPQLPQHPTSDQAFTPDLYELYSEVGARLVADSEVRLRMLLKRMRNKNSEPAVSGVRESA